MFKLDSPAEHALSNLQDTELTPMEEVLFQAWTKANQIKKPDSADDPMDYRGLYKAVQGHVMPYGSLPQIAKKANSAQRLMQALRDRAEEEKQTASDRIDQFHSEQRQDVTHQQKMEQGQLALAKAPYDAQMAAIKNQGKMIDVEGKKAAAEQQKYKTDEQLINALIPRTDPMMGMNDAAGQTGTLTTPTPSVSSASGIAEGST